MDEIGANNNAGGKPRTAQESIKARPEDARSETSSSEKNRDLVESYLPVANAMLAIATFAGTITLTIVLTPGNGNHTPGLTLLAYSSSMFIGSIMGCVFMIASIKLNVPFRFVLMEATIVGLILFSAFYLLLLASSLFSNHRGPFILGSVIYLGFGILLGMLSLLDCSKTLEKKLRLGRSLVPEERVSSVSRRL